MLRISAILTLVFYLTVSFGIHVDVDTCCKSISGISFLSEDEDHPTVSEACCPSMEKTCCSGETEKGCELDCVFIQVLSEEQVTSSTSKISCAERTLFGEEFQEHEFGQTSNADLESEKYEPPPLILLEEDIYLIHRSFTTYG